MFNDNELYAATDPRLDVIGSYQTRAKWRMERRGPRYIQLGPRRVCYRGSDLNEWINARMVEPRNNAAA